MDNPSSQKHKIYRNQAEYTDYIAIEEPLEITITQLTDMLAIHKKPVSITMRTPGSDHELALGFTWDLYNEKIYHKEHRI